MKRILAVLLMVVLTLSLVACGSGKENNSGEVSGSENNSEAPAASSEAPAVEIADALEILNTVWGNYEEADKFPVGGGDSANLNFEGPAKFDATNTGELDVTLGFPADQAANIDDAASMMNAMMANNFTAGVYHLIEGADVQALADALKTNIQSRQWMCGIPEKMVVIAVDDYVISAFGLGELIDTFKTQLQGAYEIAEVLYEESIS